MKFFVKQSLLIPITSQKQHVLEKSGLSCIVVARPLFWDHFYVIPHYDRVMPYSEQLEIWTGCALGIVTWSWKEKIQNLNFFIQNFFFPNFFFLKFFSAGKKNFRKIFSSNFSILGRFRSWGPVPLGDVTSRFNSPGSIVYLSCYPRFTWRSS